MTNIQKFRWMRVLAAIIIAELLPILLLVAIVVMYGIVSDQTELGSMTPEEFAPLAGNWVGPIGGFLAAMFMAWWAARVITEGALWHGIAVGTGTGLVDLSLGLLMGGGTISVLLVLSNCGRVLAGVAGGFLAANPRRAGRVE